MKHYLLVFLIVWVVIGTATIIYYQKVDGTWNPPLTFSVDTQALQTDKTVYHIGDEVYVRFAFCRSRNFTATTQWRLVNDIVIPFTPVNYVLSPQCVDKFVLEGIIPPAVF